jgi:hypothetical protein
MSDIVENTLRTQLAEEIRISNERGQHIEQLEALLHAEKSLLADSTRKLEEARKDAERLDWMQFNGAKVSWGNDGEVCHVQWQDRDGPHETPLFDNWREAIDQAIEQGKGG